MLEESIPSLWASMAGWFTPTVLFVLVNLVIGTIAVTSSKSSHRHRHRPDGEEEHPHRPRPLSHSPSVLQRLRSINLYRHAPPEPENRHEKAEVAATMEEAYCQEKAKVGATMEEAYAAAAAAAGRETAEEDEGHFKRSQSDSRVAKAAPPGEKARVQRRLRKAASDVSAFGKAEDDGQIGVSPPPPQSAREWRRKNQFGLDDDEEEEEEGGSGGGGGGTEVDAKADDFISRFRKQLQLQRMESMMRKEQENAAAVKKKAPK